MLTVNPRQVTGFSIGSMQSSEYMTLRDILAFLRRNFFLIAFCIASATALAGWYIWTAVPTYSATARLIIDTSQLRFALQDPTPYSLAMESAKVDSEVELVKSRAVARSVIQELDLVNEAEYLARPGLAARAKMGIKRLLGFEKTIAGSADDAELRRAMNAYYGRLGVRRIGSSYVLEISYSATSPQRAANIANAVVDAYIAAKITSQSDAARRGAEWLEVRLKELGIQANRAAASVEEFKAGQGIIMAGSAGPLAERQLLDMSAAVLQATTDATRLEARLQAVEQALMSEDVADAYLPDGLNSGVIASLRQRAIDAKARQTEAISRYGPEGDAAIMAGREIEQVEEEIRNELDRIRKVYRTELQAASLRVTATDKTFAAMRESALQRSGDLVRLAELESDAATYRRMYETLLAQFTQAVQRQSFPVSDARVIVPAVAPAVASDPKSTLILAMAIAFGGTLGLGLAAAREALDTRLTSSKQIERDLMVPCLGALPRLNGGLISSYLRPGSMRARDLDHVLKKPHSAFSRHLREVKVSLDLVLHQRAPIQIGVSAAGRTDRKKAAIASNLACLYAAEGARTLLIDADERMQTLTSNLHELGKPRRLTKPAEDVEIPAGGVLELKGHRNLSFANIDTIKPADEPYRGVAQMRRWLADLPEPFEVVIIDLPSLTVSADARAIAPHIDGILLVSDYHFARVHDLADALASFGSFGSRVLGVVLNNVPRVRLHA